MCGILCVASKSKSINGDLFSKSLSSLIHRGPDSFKIFEGDCFKFGFTRLAIQDLNKEADQPMVDDFGNSLIFNGEIYNYKELRIKLESDEGIIFKTKGDSEVLLSALHAWGIDKTLQLLSGMFAFVYFNKANSKLVAARDHFGMKPIFYTHANGILSIGSEIKALLEYTNERELDKNSSLNPIFFTGLSPSGKTMFKGVYRLMPGQMLSYDLKSDELHIREYFKYTDLVDEDLYLKISKMTDNEYANLIKEKLESAVKSHMQSDAKLGVLFSAGLDSSVIAALASKENQGKIDLFKYQSENLDDSNLVNKFKKIFHCNVKTIDGIDSQIIYELPKLIYYYETINKSDGTPLAKCCENARKNGFKVLLTGDAADEIFGGYYTFESYITKKKFKSINIFPKVKRILNKIAPGFSDLMGAELDYMVSPFSTDLLESYLDISLHGGSRKIQFEEAIGAYHFIEDKAERDINAFLLDEVGSRLERFLIRNDRFGMMESIEIRVPFLSMEIVKIAVNTPYQMKCKFMPSLIGRKVYAQKYALKKVAELLRLPKSIIYRPKVGTPMGPSNYLAQETVFDQWDLKNAAEFLGLEEKTLKKTISLASSQDEKQRQIWNMLSLEILIREFIKKVDFTDIQKEFREICECVNHE